MLRFSSLLQAVEYFRTQTDYIAFNLKEDKIEDPNTLESYALEDVEIIESLKLEASSDPDGVSIIHVVKAEGDLIGYFIDAPGVYSNMVNPENL